MILGKIQQNKVPDISSVMFNALSFINNYNMCPVSKRALLWSSMKCKTVLQSWKNSAEVTLLAELSLGPDFREVKVLSSLCSVVIITFWNRPVRSLATFLLNSKSMVIRPDFPWLLFQLEENDIQQSRCSTFVRIFLLWRFENSLPNQYVRNSAFWVPIFW